LASAIALVVGASALVGGVVSPAAGTLGDRLGFRPVLVASLLGAGMALTAVPFAPNVSSLAAVSAAGAAFYAGVGAMVFALLAVQIAPERRSATLNLVYLPLYLGGIVGPAVGALVVAAGLPVVFYAAAVVVWMGAALELIRPLTPGPES
jgi:MFS family permease